MRSILTTRQESFARDLSEGKSQRAAYAAAGYSGSGSTLDENACRLARNDKVRQRVAELQKEAASQTIKTVQSLVAGLDDAIAFARECKNPSAIVAGITAQARLLGLLVERQQVEAMHKPSPIVNPHALEMSEEEWRRQFDPQYREQ
jgi:phage terminase small subunit